ncbi:phosphatidylinositol-3,5-bisphosphate 5-phosphatase [Ptychographa xylographoides]|nr:phosphatidylinositol-3,5-bisphosphate 5-phosphatase [Ptychographa xylographoides]
MSSSTIKNDGDTVAGNQEASQNEDVRTTTSKAGIPELFIKNNADHDHEAGHFPRLSNDEPPPAASDIRDSRSTILTGRQLLTRSSGRSSSTSSTMLRNRGATYEKAGEDGVSRMHKFSLYETAVRFYLVGADVMDAKFRILKIDRTAESGDLNIAEDDIVYTKKEMNQLLNAVDDGNKASGGLKLRSSTWGLLGFIRFTGDYYMLLITKRSQVAMIGGHYVYQVDGTELVSLTSTSSTRSKSDRHPEEARFVGILNNLDLSRSFYFSYSYDVTNTLQVNICHERRNLSQDPPQLPRINFNDMFIWNHHLLEPAAKVLRNTYDWCLPIMHGFVDQAILSVYGRTVYVTIIARRSRFFAGARFLKRGANDLGYVANDVETEQIVSEMLTTSFHAPGPKLYTNPNYTSYVQHRGSIPLYWTQDSTGVTPKPDIELNLVDPFYGAAALHFDNLFERYGAPIFVLNLVKSRERTPRESILLKEYTKAIEYLNQFLPNEKKIIYKAWDMSRASKSRDQDVIGTLESIAEEVLKTTSFFHNGDGQDTGTKMQNGIARTNCIDCLDRTNAAQFVIGKLALGHQLHALGIIDDTSIEYDTDAVNLFTHMYHDHGDTIAIQYGGSHLVNTMETYRKINQWTSHSRDMVESFKRYYNNSFLDAQRQEAYNLFLGNYIFKQGQPMLWDLSTDYYLHHSDPRVWSARTRNNYVQWYNSDHLVHRQMPALPRSDGLVAKTSLEYFDDYWLEYYRPLAVSSFLKIFSFRMNSTLRYIPFKSTKDGRYDLSPFRVRSTAEHDTPEKPRHPRFAALSNDSQDVQSHDGSQSGDTPLLPPSSSGAYHEPPRIKFAEGSQDHRSILKESKFELSPIPASSDQTPKTSKTPKDKSAIAQWTLNQFVVNSLNPSVTSAEMDEYGRYISHPLNLPLVVSTDTPSAPSLELLAYIQSASNSDVSNLHSTEEDIADFVEFIDVGEDPLTVTEADTPKKRYKAYRQWLKGKSLFKQSRIDP